MRYSKNGKADKSVGLIETWDVLKLGHALPNKDGTTWLIETWDVLKCDIVAALMIPVSWLIETWDVLKLLSNHVVNSPEND